MALIAGGLDITAIGDLECLLKLVRMYMAIFKDASQSRLVGTIRIT